MKRMRRLAGLFGGLMFIGISFLLPSLVGFGGGDSPEGPGGQDPLVAAGMRNVLCIATFKQAFKDVRWPPQRINYEVKSDVGGNAGAGTIVKLQHTIRFVAPGGHKFYISANALVGKFLLKGESDTIDIPKTGTGEFKTKAVVEMDEVGTIGPKTEGGPPSGPGDGFGE